MNSFFDEDSQKLILCAKKEMQELKHPYVGSEHLFLAILHIDSDIKKTLSFYGITYQGFKKELIRVVGIGNRKSDWFLFTPLLKKILIQASLYSKDHYHFVTPEAILISIFREGDGVANRILLGMNIDVDALQDRFFHYDEDLSESSLEVLNKLGTDMSDKNLLSTFDPVIGRDSQIMQMIQILLHKNKKNPLLIGEAGVGKTAIVEELARRISIGDVPFKLREKRIYSISISNLVAGTKYRGEFEEKLQTLIEEVKRNQNIILFMDEIHTLVGAGGAEGATDASNLLKPYLARGDITIIGATTTKEYTDSISKDKAFDRRFQKIYVQEATKNEVLEILNKLCSIYEAFHHVVLSKEILSSLVELSFSCFPYGKNPDKAIDFLDEVCSYASIHKNNKEKQLSLDYKRICEIQKNKNEEIKKQNFSKALLYKKKEMKLTSEYYNQLFQEDSDSIVISEDDLYQVIYQKMRSFPPDVWSSKIQFCKRKLEKIFLGQSFLNPFLEKLSKYDYIINKDCTTFLLVGKNGLGKTFLLENIKKELFSDVNVVSLSMREFSDRHSFSKIIGSSFDSHEFLFQSILENPFSVLFLDDIDQACGFVFQELMNAFSSGFLSTAKGEKIDFHKCIVFMTCSMSSEVGFSKEKKNSFLSKYDTIKNIFYFSDLNESVIRKYLQKKLYSSEIIKDVIENSDWRRGGFSAIHAFLEKEGIQI